MPTLKDVFELVEKAGVDKSKILISKKVWREINERVKNVSFDSLIHKKV